MMMEETYQCISEWECCCWRVRSAAEDMGGEGESGSSGSGSSGSESEREGSQQEQRTAHRNGGVSQMRAE